MHDIVLLSRFEDGTLDRSDWTHRAHVKMAYTTCDAIRRT